MLHIVKLKLSLVVILILYSKNFGHFKKFIIMRQTKTMDTHCLILVRENIINNFFGPNIAE